ncbi:MAG: hypothetical protein ACP5G5_01820 [Thermoplasmata archaeon]|jgi:hypothetical protein|nr:hypothetical protein [Thermoplasmatales archaeon]
MIKFFQISSIEAKRYIRADTLIPEVKIDTNSTVTEIRVLDKNQVEITFRFSASYSGIGFIAMEGSIIWEGNVQRMENEWKNKHNLPEEYVQEIHAAIINNCIIEAIIISKEIRLPPPIPPPVQLGQKPKPPEGMDYH